MSALTLLGHVRSEFGSLDMVVGELTSTKEECCTHNVSSKEQSSLLGKHSYCFKISSNIFTNILKYHQVYVVWSPSPTRTPSSTLGTAATILLAAAVSDFYVFLGETGIRVHCDAMLIDHNGKSMFG